MTVRSRLHFACSSAEAAESIVARLNSELGLVLRSEFPEVTIVDCEGPRIVRLRPAWLEDCPNAASITSTVQQRGDTHHLLIEISEKEGE